MPTLKIFIAGLKNSGKTELIKTISDLPLVSIDKKIVKTETIVDMDYGRVTLNQNMIYMYAPVKETNFVFLWESLASEMHGSLFLVDSTDPFSFQKAAEVNDIFSTPVHIPHLVVANKTDSANAASLIEVQKAIRVSDDDRIISCVATSKPSVRQVLLKMLVLLNQY